MATSTVEESTGGERYSEDIPSNILGPVPIKDLPEPLPLRKVLGPGVILLATALGSGEYVLWPFIASHIGLTIMWAAIVAIAIQFFINMEVERWTLATGETAITGFTRLWKPWWFLFIIMAVVPNMWPGFATGAATCLSFVVGDLNIQLVGILGLIAVGITLTASPVVYQTVERLQTVVIGAVIVWLALAVVLGTTSDAWGDLVSGFGSFGTIETNEAVTAAALAGAIAFAGSGGCGNLAVSNWVRDKGMGMGHYIPRIVSPMSGEQEARAVDGQHVRDQRREHAALARLVEGGQHRAGRDVLADRHGRDRDPLRARLLDRVRQGHGRGLRLHQGRGRRALQTPSRPGSRPCSGSRASSSCSRRCSATSTTSAASRPTR